MDVDSIVHKVFICKLGHLGFNGKTILKRTHN